MLTKVRVSVGATINFGDYNSGRVTIDIEEEGESISPSDKIDRLAITVENKLVEKLKQLFERLESEGFLGGN